MANIVLFTCHDVICLGMRYLSSYLRSHGHHVTMIFFKKNVSTPKVKKSDTDTMYTMYLPGEIYGCNHDVNPYSDIELDLLVSLIESINPDIIGLSTRSFWLKIDGSVIVERIREACPNSLLIAGGYGPSLLPHDFAKLFDYVCFGEGENALLNIANLFDSNERERLKKAHNLFYYDDRNKFVNNALDKPIKNLDALPFPDWDDEESYYIESNKIIRDKAQVRRISWYDIFASRGCSSSCTYCMAGQWNKLYKSFGNICFPKVRVRSPENVISELKLCKKKYELKYIRFMDSIFTTSEKWLDRFIDLYTQHISLPFFCNIEMRFQSMQIIKKLCDAGMHECSFGIQSGSDYIRKNIFNRRISNEKIIEVAEFLHNNNVNYQQDLIGFNPFDTEVTLSETFQLLCDLPPNRTVVFHLDIFPNSELDILYHEIKPARLDDKYHMLWIYMWHLASCGSDSRLFAKDIYNDVKGKTPFPHHDDIKMKWLSLKDAQNASLFRSTPV